MNNSVVKTQIDRLLGPRRKGMKFRVKTNNRVRALGVTDEKKRTVTINRKWNKPGDKHRRTKSRKIPEVLRTKIHEFGHVQYPHETEKQVERRAKRLAAKATPKQKKRIYDKQTIVRNNNIDHR